MPSARRFGSRWFRRLPTTRFNCECRQVPIGPALFRLPPISPPGPPSSPTRLRPIARLTSPTASHLGLRGGSIGQRLRFDLDRFPARLYSCVELHLCGHCCGQECPRSDAGGLDAKQVGSTECQNWFSALAGASVSKWTASAPYS